MHPDKDDLLRYADGELTGGAARRIRKHLKACWQCRAELQETQAVINSCVSYRKDFLERLLPPPPAPWPDIYAQFARLDASAEPEFFGMEKEDRRRLVVRAVKWTAIAAVALLTVGMLVSRFRQTPSVEASELLRKAAAAEDAAPRRVRRIRIETRKHHLVRMAGFQQHAAYSAADADALNSLGAMFIAASYDWQDPLSARSFEGWREQASSRRDEVQQGDNDYRVRTTAGSGELVAASLTLRKKDLHPIEGRFEFRNREWVEMTEVEEQPSEVRMTAKAPLHPDREVTDPTAPTSAATTAVREATVSDELQVVATLHQLGADLGDPIEVRRNGGKVLVSGIGISAGRQHQITDALRTTPNVELRFTNSTAATIEPEKETPADTAVTEFRDLQARIARTMGGREFFDQLGAETLDLTESMMARAYALRLLAERFPPAAESQMSSSDRELLRKLRSEHTNVLRQQASQIDRALRPVLRSLGVAPLTAPDVSYSTNWEIATEDLFQSARQVEKLSAVLFGASRADGSEDQTPPQLGLRIAELRSKLDAYDRIATPARSDK
jgi:hypothetical protein